VVVEEGRSRIGERLQVTVTGALQTSTGRLVFARNDKPRASEPAADPKGPDKTRERRSEKETGRGSPNESNDPLPKFNTPAARAATSPQAGDAPPPGTLPSQGAN